MFNFARDYELVQEWGYFNIKSLMFWRVLWAKPEYIFIFKLNLKFSIWFSNILKTTSLILLQTITYVLVLASREYLKVSKSELLSVVMCSRMCDFQKQKHS